MEFYNLYYSRTSIKKQKVGAVDDRILLVNVILAQVDDDLEAMRRSTMLEF